MTIPGKLLTTAMAVMPHADIDQALNTALSLDIPFWPQLPNYSYYEDRYVQAAEHFPGIIVWGIVPTGFEYLSYCNLVLGICVLDTTL